MPSFSGGRFLVLTVSRNAVDDPGDSTARMTVFDLLLHTRRKALNERSIVKVAAWSKFIIGRSSFILPFYHRDNLRLELSCCRLQRAIYGTNQEGRVGLIGADCTQGH